MIRFLVMGLPRSGTTYLSTLINSHRQALCEGELFNPHGIVRERGPERQIEALQARDTDPVGFLEDFWLLQPEGVAALGCKWMIGHHVEILRYIAEHPGIRLIYVYRENKLAQAASFAKALETRKWAVLNAREVSRETLQIGPLPLAQRIRELETQDYLFANWLAARPNPSLSVEYRGLFEAGFKERLCGFLGIDFDPAMRSPLVKQGSREVIAGFERRRMVASYFRAIGRKQWFRE